MHWLLESAPATDAAPYTATVPPYDGRRGQAIVLCKRRQFIAHGSVHGGTLCCATRRLKKEEMEEEGKLSAKRKRARKRGSSSRLKIYRSIYKLLDYRHNHRNFDSYYEFKNL